MHHLVLENELVRVFAVEIPPGQPTKLHRHRHDYIFVALGAAEISNEVEGRTPVKLRLAAGEVGYTEGGFAHVARNLGSTPFRVLAVEILPAGKRRAAAQPSPQWERGLEIFDGGTQHTLLVRGGLRVADTELQPGGTTPLHTHPGPHLAISLTDVELSSQPAGKPPVVIRKKAGEFDWVAGESTHTLTNNGKQTARYVSIEFP